MAREYIERSAITDRANITRGPLHVSLQGRRDSRWHGNFLPTCITLDLLRIVFPDGWYRSMSLRIPRTPTSSASTRRKAVILTKLYLKSSRSKVSISWNTEMDRVFETRGSTSSGRVYLRKLWRDSGTCSRSFAAAISESRQTFGEIIFTRRGENVFLLIGSISFFFHDPYSIFPNVMNKESIFSRTKLLKIYY